MTTTSTRPPAKTPKKTPKNRTRRRPADAPTRAKTAPARRPPPAEGTAKSAATKSTATKSTATKSTATKSTATKSTATRSTATRTTAVKSAATRAAAKTAPAKTAKNAAARPRPAGPRRTHAPPRTPFVLLIVGLLGGALVSLLLLNTVLAKDAFTLTRLQQSNQRLEEQRQAYEAANAREGSPQALSNKAKALGMKEAEDPAFFDTRTGRASDGRIRPVPHAAAAAAGAAGVVGVPGTVVPGDGVPTGTRNSAP